MCLSLTLLIHRLRIIDAHFQHVGLLVRNTFFVLDVTVNLLFFTHWGFADAALALELTVIHINANRQE